MNSATIKRGHVHSDRPGSHARGSTVAYRRHHRCTHPTAVLSTSYPVYGHVTTGVRDPAGTALAANFAWTFTTGAQLAWLVTVPSNGAGSGSHQKHYVAATFSEVMNPATINGGPRSL